MSTTAQQQAAQQQQLLQKLTHPRADLSCCLVAASFWDPDRDESEFADNYRPALAAMTRAVTTHLARSGRSHLAGDAGEIAAALVVDLCATHDFAAQPTPNFANYARGKLPLSRWSDAGAAARIDNYKGLSHKLGEARASRVHELFVRADDDADDDDHGRWGVDDTHVSRALECCDDVDVLTGSYPGATRALLSHLLPADRAHGAVSLAEARPTEPDTKNAGFLIDLVLDDEIDQIALLVAPWPVQPITSCVMGGSGDLTDLLARFLATTGLPFTPEPPLLLA